MTTMLISVPVPLTFYTGRHGRTRGDDLFDITRGTGRGDGLAFAPSTQIFHAAQAAKKRGGMRAWAEAWAAYVPCYRAEMYISSGQEVPLALAMHAAQAIDRGVVANIGAWQRLLEQPTATLLCWCETNCCHRYLLADLLVALGARYGGERTPDD